MRLVPGASSDRVSSWGPQIRASYATRSLPAPDTDCTPSLDVDIAGSPALLLPRQTLNQVIETQPQTPAMMIERQGKRDASNKKHCQHLLFVEVGDEQAKKVNRQD